MSEKRMNTRVQHKIDTSENWSKATNFSPLEGELIIYSDLNQIKIGDGSTNVNDLPFINTSSGNDSSAIIDVVELPTENINEQAFYRVLTGTFVFNNTPMTTYTCHCVETLPENGIPVTDADMTVVIAYYNNNDGICYGYIDDMLSAGSGVPAGWYNIGDLLVTVEYAYGGVVNSMEEASAEEVVYLVLGSLIHSYKDGAWTAQNNIGWAGTAIMAEVFNSPNNIASGDTSHAEGYDSYAEGSASHAEGELSHAEGWASHAEGYDSHAEGDSSHAEGNASHAEGWASHAEGCESHAEGDASHAEGELSHAEGWASHAEGYYSHAEGDYSHAEGCESHAKGCESHAEGEASHAEGYASHAEGCESHAEGDHSHAEGTFSHAEGQSSHAEGYASHASGRSQHAQGEYNISDPDANPDDPSQRGRYAHIVGNGTSEANRSNAYTLDWDGNAWFAGDVYVSSASGKDRDEGSKKLATEE